jgi:hypothetical protein
MSIFKLLGICTKYPKHYKVHAGKKESTWSDSKQIQLGIIDFILTKRKKTFLSSQFVIDISIICKCVSQVWSFRMNMQFFNY